MRTHIQLLGTFWNRLVHSSKGYISLEVVGNKPHILSDHDCIVKLFLVCESFGKASMDLSRTQAFSTSLHLQ